VEPSEPELERTARRVRRVLLAFRLIFYPGAVIVAVLLLTGRSSGYSETWLGGRTDQERSITIRLDDGRPGVFSTTLVGTCPRGRQWPRRWIQRDDPREPFRFDDHRLTVTHRSLEDNGHGWTGHVTLRLTARIEDDAVTGTMTLVERSTHPDATADYVCESGPVSFSAAAE
jgi:hypothetical protein